MMRGTDRMGVDDVTAPLCGSLQAHLGTEMPSGGGHIINAQSKQAIFLKTVVLVRGRNA